MIKEKEYPATHSMSTSWFAVDSEGNVGLIEFNANGPVPTVVQPESCIEYIIQDVFVDMSGKIKRSILNNEQVDLLVSCLDFKPFSKKASFLFNSLWRTNPQLKDEFFDIMKGNEDAMVIFSENKGLYWVNYLSDSEEYKIFKRLRKSSCLLSYAHFWLDLFEEESLKVILPKGYEKFPMFIYAQEYWNPALQRIHSPSVSVKAKQLTEDNKERALHLPFSFRDTEQFQIPFYYPSFWMSGEDLSPSDARYTTLKIEENKTPFVRTAELAIPTHIYRDDYSSTFTFEPTIAIIKKDDSYILEKLPGYVLKHAFELNYLNRSEYLKELLKYYRPYLLIVMGGALSSLENHFSIIDKKLILDDEEYPIFTSGEVVQRKEEIIALATKSYRGSKDPMILDKKE